ncbi:DMT family transporter [Acrocarpospora sp. B8E8]|uniref:DMT family transporter n=1 Tax=Acrocarpospora sp. B8E8 TaxID=3153572 RepID=UPI00325D4F8B
MTTDIKTAHALDLQAVAMATSAMFMVGTLAAVSDVIQNYPLYGGQAVRYAVAAVVLFVVAQAMDTRRFRAERLTSRDRVLLVLLSLTGLVIFNICVIESARHAGPALVGTVLGTVPLALALCAPIPAMLSRAKPTPPSRRILIAAAVVVAGATLATGLGSGTPAALLWALGALACEVCFSLLALPLLPKLGAIRVSAYSAALAVPSLLVLGVVFDGTGILRVPTLAEALGLGYLALIVTTVAFFLWYSALPRLGPGKAGLFAGMIPVGAIGTGVVLGLGVPSVADLAGAALVIVGILIGLRPERGVVQ